jgi:hypothetical protein
MTTPTNFQRLPSESSFYNGQMVMGAQASSLALALKQMQGVKYRALANYHVSRTTWQILYWIGPVYTEAQLNTGHGTMEKGESEDIDLLIGTMPSSEWLAIELVYGPTNLVDYVPQVIIELYTLGITGAPRGVKIDEGIRFQAPYDLVSARQGSGTGVQRTHTGAQPYAFPSGGLSSFTEPRPLYVPEANRGDVLLLSVQAENCRVFAVNVFDIYKEAQ